MSSCKRLHIGRHSSIQLLKLGKLSWVAMSELRSEGTYNSTQKLSWDVRCVGLGALKVSKKSDCFRHWQYVFDLHSWHMVQISVGAARITAAQCHCQTSIDTQVNDRLTTYKTAKSAVFQKFQHYLNVNCRRKHAINRKKTTWFFHWIFWIFSFEKIGFKSDLNQVDLIAWLNRANPDNR